MADSKRDRIEKIKRRRLTSMIRKWDDPILKQVCDLILPGENIEWVHILPKICNATARGVGLAAPQMGRSKCAIYVAAPNCTPKIMINPVLLEWSKTEAVMVEGCLSFPDIEGPVYRPTWVKVRYFRPDDTMQEHPIEEVFKDFEARVVCHEIDHLLGICVVGKFWEASLRSPDMVNG